MKIKRLLLIAVSMIAITAAYSQTVKPVDHLHIPGPITFHKAAYSLNWSSRPSGNFYKQEYIVAGDNADHFKTMILVDVLTGTADLKGTVSAKIAELKKMKETNPIINYEVYDNTKSGEYMLDFLLTANSADGKYVSIAERNVYRYKIVTDKEGKKSVLLFGFSTRSYGNDISGFLSTLKSSKADLVKEVASFTIPAPVIN